MTQPHAEINALREAGRYDEANRRLEAWLACHPDDAVAHAHRAHLLSLLDRTAEASQAIERALSLAPAERVVQRNLARLLLKERKPHEALRAAEGAWQASPGDPESRVVLAAALAATGRDDQALLQIEGALRADPGCAEALANRALLRLRAGQFAAALADAESALSIKPHLALWPTVGLLRRQLNNIPGAIAAYETALAQDPRQIEAVQALAFLAVRQENWGEAERHFRRAIELVPNHAEIHANLGAALHKQNRWGEASGCYRAALAIDPRSAEAHHNLADILAGHGKIEEAADHYARAVAIKPDFAKALNGLLFALQYHPGKTAADIYEQTMKWGDLLAAPHYHKAKPLGNSRNPDKRLRIGYLGPDFKGHASAYFLMPLFQNHDRDAFEIFVYAQVASPDAWTQKFMEIAHSWHFTHGMGDDELADLIRSQAIDILVDLGGHTLGSRVLTMARRPAPVQLSWIGHGNTTGVKTVDYFLTDPHYVPADHERLFCEAVWRLPRIAYCYDPLHSFPDIGPLPSRVKGYTTFGCFARAIRLNRHVIESWAKLLSVVPRSELLLNNRSLADPEAREVFHRGFEAHGISRERIRLICTAPMHDTWAAYNEVDIALDPFPHNAGLTTYEALWMGVPVLTLQDRPPQGRYGTSILTNAGLPEFIAENVEDYVRIGADWAGEPNRLEALRRDLRERMRRSPLCDGPAFAKDIENAYRKMWRLWCSG